MDNAQYKGPVCRGCWALGNNCKFCERCIATKPTSTEPRPTEAFAHPLLVEALREAIGAIENDTGLDEAICCSGHDCGCRASTHRDLLLHNLRAALSEVSHG